MDERPPRGLVKAVMPANGRDAGVELLEEEVDRVLRQEEERPAQSLTHVGVSERHAAVASRHDRIET